MPAECGRPSKARLRWASLPLLADGAASIAPGELPFVEPPEVSRVNVDVNPHERGPRHLNGIHASAPSQFSRRSHCRRFDDISSECIAIDFRDFEAADVRSNCERLFSHLL